MINALTFQHPSKPSLASIKLEAQHVQFVLLILYSLKMALMEVETSFVLFHWL